MKIYITTKIPDILRTATKIKYMKYKPFTKEEFAEYMLKMIEAGRTILMVAKEDTGDRRIYAAAVISLVDAFTKKIAWIDYTWVDKDKKELGKELMKQIEEMAKLYNVDCIQGRVYRGTAGAEKKYGFKKVYEVIEKQLIKEKEDGRNK
ncbi:MAG: hypothetical protein U9R36_01090 [Elusimicrobiota bacterium]|nr:hypothetical protein [Elusimicrobiota bacterium]